MICDTIGKYFLRGTSHGALYGNAERVHVFYNYWKRVVGFVKNMRKLLPDKYFYVIVADRGFQGRILTKGLKRLKIDCVIRINNSII